MLRVSRFLREGVKQPFCAALKHPLSQRDFCWHTGSGGPKDQCRGGFPSSGEGFAFGWVNYEFKDQIEDLHSGRVKRYGFPDLFFFTAKDHQCIREDDDGYDVPERPPAMNCRFRSRLSKQEYISTVRALQEHIQRGDIYEVNFCMEFYAEGVKIDPIQTFIHLCSLSKAPFSGFMKYEENFMIGASPERFMKRSANKLTSQPMKGTGKRSGDRDQPETEMLRNDPKERSENIMITDLVRNDLSKVAERNSVKVEELCGIYSFPGVHQMISTISCAISSTTNLRDIIHAAFPPGSMTGAPKPESMRLIEKYERSRRELYAGCFGFMDPEGDFDLSVVIRSLFYNRSTGYLSFHVGSAITALSDPEMEFEECLLKSSKMIEALGADIPIFA